MSNTKTANANLTDTDSAEARARRRREKQANLSASEMLKRNSTVIVAVIAGVITSLVKFIAAAITGSSAMFSEGIHSMVDAINDSLLLVGGKLSEKKPDVHRPFGYGPEMYFYSLTVALVIFVLGGGYAIYEGLQSVAAGGHPIESPFINYIVLGIGIVVEGFSLSVAVRTVNKARGDLKIMAYIRESKSPTNITVFLEDAAAVLGMIVALIGNIASTATGYYVIDAWASVIIGVIMASIAVILLKETRSLVIGEGMTTDEVQDVIFIVESDPDVIKCGRVLSLYLGPDELLITLDVTFKEDIDEGGVLTAIDRIEGEIMDEYPQATRIFVEPESLNQVYRQRRDRKLAFQDYIRAKENENRSGTSRQEEQGWREEMREQWMARREERRAKLAQLFNQTYSLQEEDVEGAGDTASQPSVRKVFDIIPNIMGDQVTVGMVVDTDVEAVTALRKDEAAQKTSPAYLFENQGDDVAERIREMYGDIYKEKKSLILAIRLKDTGELAGLVELYGLRDSLRKISVGYRLRESFQDRGIESEALKLMVGYLYGKTDIEIITANVRSDDERSAKALEDADFIRTSRYVESDWGYDKPTIIDKWFC